MTENVLLRFDMVVGNLSRQLKYGGDALEMVPETVKVILGRNRYNEPMWPRRFCEILGEEVTFRTFVEFVEKSPPRGLGTTVQMLKNVCRDDTEAVDLIDQAVRNPIGTNQHMAVNNVNGLARPKGNSRDRALRQLRDHRPDLHAQVLSRELSAHAAMIEAGFRTRSFTVPDDIDAAAPILRRRFADRLPALIPALSATDVETHPNAEVTNGGAELDMLAKMPLVIEPSEAPSMCEAKEISEKAGPAAPRERIGRAPRQREAVPKRQHAPANDTLATDRRVEDVRDRLAALSAEERALVAGVMVDRWGTAEAPAASDEDDDESSLHAQCLDLAALGSGWTDVVVAMAITRVIGTALYAPDAPKIPAPDQTKELIATLTEWINRLQGPVDAQPGCNSAITVGTVGDGYYTSDPAQSAGSEQPRVVALEGGEAIIVWHSAGSRTSKQPVRKWKVSPPHPEARYPVSVSVYFVEPRKRRGKCTNVDPNNLQYLTVELADGTVLYDSRAEVPYDATKRWPSREEWAKDRRTYYGDDQNPASRRLSEYASPAEVKVIIGALKQSYHDLGRCLAEAKAAAGAACQQPAETNKQYSARWALMSDPEQSLMKKVYDAQDQRRVINQALKLIARDELPFLRDEGGTRFEIAVATARYEAACRVAEQARRDEVAQQPIDDAAWEKELQRRARIEEWNPLEVE